MKVSKEAVSLSKPEELPQRKPMAEEIKVVVEQPLPSTARLMQSSPEKTATEQCFKGDYEGVPIKSLAGAPVASASLSTARIHVELVWQNVSITVAGDASGKKILSNVSGIVKPGQFLAIIGASGAGKTTLLNYLSGKMLAHELIPEGVTLINGKSTKIDQNYLEFTAFVQQEDILMETLTVMECLEYAALLKYSADPKIRNRRIGEVMEELELNDVKDIRFGGLRHNGRVLNRGEKKRLSIAVELMTNPSLLFLDEPTTSMDTFTAEKIVQIVNRLKEKGRTIIATIHQPNTQIYNSFDQLMIMALGRTIYQNEARDAVTYFASINYPCPSNKNPADYFMSLLSEDTYSHTGNVQKTYPEFIEEMGKKYLEGPKCRIAECNPQMPELTDDFVRQRKFKASWMQQFHILYKRASLNSLRLLGDEILRIFTIIVLGLFMLALYYDIPNTGYVALQNRVGAIFMLSITMIMGSATYSVLSFPEERAVLMREQASSMYEITPYFFSKVLAGIPFAIHQPVILTIMLYWAIPLHASGGSFVIFLVSMFFGYQVGVSYSLLLGAFITNRESLITLAPLITVPLIMLSGFYVSLDKVVPILWPFQWISGPKYMFNIQLRNEFIGNDKIHIYQGPYQLTGEDIIKRAGVDMEIWQGFIGLMGLYIGFLTCALLGLKFTSKRM